MCFVHFNVFSSIMQIKKKWEKDLLECASEVLHWQIYFFAIHGATKCSQTDPKKHTKMENMALISKKINNKTLQIIGKEENEMYYHVLLSQLCYSIVYSLEIQYRILFIKHLCNKEIKIL